MTRRAGPLSWRQFNRLSAMAKATTRDLRHEQTEFARRVLDAEVDAIRRIAIEAPFHAAVEMILDRVGSRDGRRRAGGPSPGELRDTGGALVVSGLGKSGLIGQKLSATFASTGTPSHFMHPVEAMHGDLGRVRRGDVVLLLSFTGHTDEVVTLAELLRQDGLAVVAIVGKPACDLARLATVTLSIGDVSEACPLNLAPTASATAMLALGDALALAVSRQRDFGVEDFRKLHPSGGLGRQLMALTEAMRFRVGKNLPVVDQRLTVAEAYTEAQRFAEPGILRRAGVLLVAGSDGRLAGIVTDSDLRTALIEKGPGVWSGQIESLMTRNPTTLGDDALVRDAVRVVREHRFDEIPIVDAEGRPVGLIDVQDLVALKVIEG